MTTKTGATAMNLDLTKGEKEALMHRLTVPDAIIEALTDEDDSPKWHEADIEYVIESIAMGRLDDAFAHSEAIARAVLIDCVDGSTWVRVSYSGGPRQQAIAYRQLCGLARKIESLLGLEKPIDVPMC